MLRPKPLRSVPYAWNVVASAVAVIVFTLAFLHPGLLIRRGHFLFSEDVFYMRGIYRFHVALLGAFLVGWLLHPALRSAAAQRSQRSSSTSRRGTAVLAVAGTAIVLGAFIIFFGRWQFGGFDYNILLEVGWRQILGQQPYVDFLTTSPPLFNLGMSLAFHLFGVSWDAMLFFTALFTAGTLVWLYLLFRRLGLGIFAALGVSCTLETATMLCCCFWWYNNTTLLLAALFFLSSIALLQLPPSRFAQTSYVLSLALLGLAKPNIAGVTIAGCVALLLLGSKQRLRIALLTIAGVVLTLLVFKAAHISIPAMLTSYRGAAKERGAFSTFGFDEFNPGEKDLIEAWYVALCLPLVRCIAPLATHLRARRYRRAAFWLFFPLAAVVAIYGLRGNGELRDVETTVLVSAVALLAFVVNAQDLLLRRYVVALFCAMAVSNLYTGASRDRVYTVGPHLFFEWTDRDHVMQFTRLQHMRVSETFLEVNQEIQQALGTNNGPFFFGPRVDYSYMAFGLPSPKHFPAWWHPGTAFDRVLMPGVIAQWDQQRFPTLIFLKDDYTYYPPAFLHALETEYLRDDRYPRITLYRRRPGS